MGAWQVKRIEAVKRTYGRVAADSANRRGRTSVFKQLAELEQPVWKLWAKESDLENALKTKGSNLRPDSPFLIEWEAAFQGALGSDFAFTPSVRGAKEPSLRSWHTDELLSKEH